MEQLMKGVSRFRDAVYPEHKQRLETLGRDGQSPTTLMISCSDSRVVPELITQSQPGELFVIRNAGNIVPPWQRVNGGVTSTIEYAVMGLGVTDIVICGHADCGAMKAHFAPEGALDAMPSVKEWIGHSTAAHSVIEACCGSADDGEKLDRLVEENVVLQLTHLRSHPCVAAALAKGELRLHGWVFDISEGAIRALDGESGKFRRMEDPQHPVPVADFGGNRQQAREAA
ncbi:carbonic anhydrase [Qipengyuania citrea]|jgi:carbonic anhydrase|uniref:Carbonic anhydrase n=1 Tax=Qipengyuania citrea TaxID=225971 RepID=A0ABY4U400_9SPHN|nr:carbonic anhydrase [Qipengyuania citrea]MBL4896612.1 carbonic anhydrase [Erythrobacter sp.]QPL40740.1 carbonic anhydrase [Erythrobacter sp. A30-3]USA60828.1 carbonic anhydrase [Qipengyuania citrea]HAD15614.1 carbonic anhydrase [Erythrobacter sp.]HAG36482.1 carbonic anhydrase [Erythrobacter sp.]|tara:strand:- start:3760 stop:4446 length:687 start_codon:yes stop_codon:yes gene_type:complete